MTHINAGDSMGIDPQVWNVLTANLNDDLTTSGLAITAASEIVLAAQEMNAMISSRGEACSLMVLGVA